MTEYQVLLDKAIELAKKVHQNQVDKAGKPYIEHPLHVMNSVDTLEEKIVAVLHDASEDSDLTFEDLTAAGFPENIVRAIDSLTRRPDENYKTYLQRVIDNPLALNVKIADMSHNADITRILEPTDKDRQRVKKYQKNILKLQKARESRLLGRERIS